MSPPAGVRSASTSSSARTSSAHVRRSHPRPLHRSAHRRHRDSRRCPREVHQSTDRMTPPRRNLTARQQRFSSERFRSAPHFLMRGHAHHRSRGDKLFICLSIPATWRSSFCSALDCLSPALSSNVQIFRYLQLKLRSLRLHAAGTLTRCERSAANRPRTQVAMGSSWQRQLFETHAHTQRV